MTAQLQTGDRAPDFALATGKGEEFALSALRGNKVVLFFYPQDDTETCTAEAIAFNALRAKFAKAGVKIVGISPDSIASHEKFRKKHGLALRLAADESKTAIEAYGIWQEKTLFGRKYMGVERTTVLIDREGKIAQVWRKVRIAGHAEEVLEAARAL
jgi:thioredoxin-dependent peroxiredoxin